MPSVFEPLNAVYATSVLRNDTCVDIATLIGTPTDKAGAPFHSAVKAVPRPVRFAADISDLRQRNRHDLVIAVSDTV